MGQGSGKGAAFIVLNVYFNALICSIFIGIHFFTALCDGSGMVRPTRRELEASTSSAEPQGIKLHVHMNLNAENYSSSKSQLSFIRSPSLL